MARKPTIKIEGLDELMKQVQGLGDKAMPYLQDGANRAGELILNRTRSRAPVLTGKLRDNLQLKPAKIDAKYRYKTMATVWFSDDTQYGIYVELGHRVMRGGKQVGKAGERPFLRPAADESKKEAIEIMRDAMNKALKEHGGE